MPVLSPEMREYRTALVQRIKEYTEQRPTATWKEIFEVFQLDAAPFWRTAASMRCNIYVSEMDHAPQRRKPYAERVILGPSIDVMEKRIYDYAAKESIKRFGYIKHPFVGQYANGEID